MTAPQKNISKRIALFCCAAVCCIASMPLFARVYRNPTSHGISSQEAFEVHVSPNGSWATSEGMQDGLFTLWNTRSNSAKRTFKKAYPNVTFYPWSPDSHALIIFKSSAFSLFYPQNELLKSVPYIGRIPNIMRTTSPPFVWSPNSRYIANGEDGYNFKKKEFISDVMVWDTQRMKLRRYPFLNVREMTWVNSNTLFVIGFKGGATTTTEKEQMALVNIQTNQLNRFTIVHNTSIGNIFAKVSPYPDAKGHVLCVLYRPSEDILCYLDLKKRKMIAIDHLEKKTDDRDWQLLWSNPRRIYLWRATSSGYEIKVFFPEKRTLSSTYTFHITGGISADEKGNLWGWKNGRLVNLGAILK